MNENAAPFPLLQNPNATPMGSPDGILFDWDSTLVDNWGSINLALNKTLEFMGKEPWTEEITRTRIGYSARDTFPTVFGDRADEAKEYFYARFTEVHLDGLQPMPGAEEMLQNMQAAGLYLAVVSNKTGRFLRKEAAHFGWERYFGKIIGATDAKRDKPARDPIDMALNGSGYTAGPNIWYVGDTALDMACARNANCRSVLIGQGNFHQKEFGDCIPDCYVRHCSELLAFFESH